MEPRPRPSPTKVRADVASSSAGTQGVHVCERCGERMEERQCKIICNNCGRSRDCSDP
jgi:ribosomal protein L37AE/L43A